MISEEENAVIAKLRQNIGDELSLSVTSLPVEDQDLYLVRWVRARDLDLEKSTNMLRNSLKWRKERRADEALDFKIHPFYIDNFKLKFGGISTQGQPVFLFPLNDWDFRKIVNDADRLAEFEDFATHFFELICKHIRDEHVKRKESGQGEVTQMILFMDVKNFFYMQLINMTAIKKLLQLAAMYEEHYPEILHQGVFINCPSYFGMFITMLKAVIAPKTLAKLRCYPKMSEWQNDIKEIPEPKFQNDMVAPRRAGENVLF